ncbi:MAG: PD40 domain-containing protein [Pirellulales bacterium]|nr:PD40 domain-containing protein [Pirellulales bacterium]
MSCDSIARCAGAAAVVLGALISVSQAESPRMPPEIRGLGRPILFVVRRQYLPDHHNTETMFQTGEINTASFRGGGALKTFDPATGAVGTLLDLPEGVVRDPDVRFDGRKILFSMRRNAADDYHLYEIRADGSGLTQLTFGSGTTDIDPLYLPDGRVLFTSTREPKYCMCNRHIMGNLFVMDADGSNIRQIGHSTLHEGHASLLPDGRVLYDRWEYVDRNFGDAQGLWTVNPDGTNHAVYWGNNTNSPGAVLEGRAVPGSERFIATFSSCHDRPWGALAIVDRRLGLDGKPPVVRTWPPEAMDLIGVGNYDTFTGVHPKYEDPYPLSDTHFLCSRMTGNGEQMGIYLLSVSGEDVLVHAEEPGCFDPMPLGPREQPPAVPPRVDLAEGEGSFYVADVYRGAGMEQVPRGTIKSLRVVESPEKRFWTHQNWQGSGTQAPGMAWDDFNNKRILGTVPVEPDGSVYFTLRADTFVYFQLLDREGRMVQTMRSGTIVRPGETAGCVGCHENRRTTVPPLETRLAMLRPARHLEPWHGPARKFSYTAEVQPVFDNQCVRCHDYGAEGGEKLNLAGDLNLVFNTSYVELRSKGFVQVIGAGPHQMLPPKTWGSHVSRLAKVLLEGHRDPKLDQEIHLTPEQVDRVITWIDINAPYYPDYAGGAFRQNLYGRSPLTPPEVGRLSELTGIDLNHQEHAGEVSFTRPERSPCLRNLPQADPRYAEALSILRAGRDRLAATPRPDIPGFVLVDPTEIQQENKYQTLLMQEARRDGTSAERGRPLGGSQ